MSWQSFNLHTFSYGGSEPTPTNGFVYSVHSTHESYGIGRVRVRKQKRTVATKPNEEKEDVDEVKR